MKTIKSKEELTRLAVRRGASVQLQGGQVLNRSRTKETIAARTMAPKVASEPPKPPVEPPTKDPTSRMVSVLAGVQAETNELLKVLVSKEPAAAPPPSTYRFRITERDKNGLISEIVAVPIMSD
jgi:hypothetical protein